MRQLCLSVALLLPAVALGPEPCLAMKPVTRHYVVRAGATRRGRPRKFSRPARAVTLTLPEDTIATLRGIDRDLGRTVSSVPGYRARAQSARQGRDQIDRVATQDMEGPAEAFDRGAESRERVVQPPARRSAEGPDARADLVVNEEAEQGAAGGHGRQKGRIVGDTQVVAK